MWRCVNPLKLRRAARLPKCCTLKRCHDTSSIGSASQNVRLFQASLREGDKLRSVHIGASHDPLVQLLERRHRLGKATHNARRDDNEKERAWLATVDNTINCYSRQLNRLLQVWLRVHSISICRDGSCQVKRLRKRVGETVPVNLTKDDFDELVVLAGKEMSKLKSPCGN